MAKALIVVLGATLRFDRRYAPRTVPREVKVKHPPPSLTAMVGAWEMLTSPFDQTQPGSGAIPVIGLRYLSQNTPECAASSGRLLIGFKQSFRVWASEPSTESAIVAKSSDNFVEANIPAPERVGLSRKTHRRR